MVNVTLGGKRMTSDDSAKVEKGDPKWKLDLAPNIHSVNPYATLSFTSKFPPPKVIVY